MYLINLEYNSEAIPKMVERLRAEHRDFRLELIQIEEASKFSSHKAIEILKEIGKSILRHEAEEEARIIRIIMENAKESEQSVKVMQEHRGVIDLLENKISQFEDSSQEVAEQIKGRHGGRQTSLYCDCPGGACVSSSWPCPSGYNDDSNFGPVAWNGQGQAQDQGQTASVKGLFA